MKVNKQQPPVLLFFSRMSSGLRFSPSHAHFRPANLHSSLKQVEEERERLVVPQVFRLYLGHHNGTVAPELGKSREEGGIISNPERPCRHMSDAGCSCMQLLQQGLRSSGALPLKISSKQSSTPNMRSRGMKRKMLLYLEQSPLF